MEGGGNMPIWLIVLLIVWGLVGLLALGFWLLLVHLKRESIRVAKEECARVLLRADEGAEFFEELKEQMEMKRCPDLAKIWLCIFDPARMGELEKERIGLHCAKCPVCGTRFNLLVRANPRRYRKQIEGEGFRSVKFGPRNVKPL